MRETQCQGEEGSTVKARFQFQLACHLPGPTLQPCVGYGQRFPRGRDWGPQQRGSCPWLIGGLAVQGSFMLLALAPIKSIMGTNRQKELSPERALGWVPEESASRIQSQCSWLGTGKNTGLVSNRPGFKAQPLHPLAA